MTGRRTSSQEFIERLLRSCVEVETIARHSAHLFVARQAGQIRGCFQIVTVSTLVCNLVCASSPNVKARPRFEPHLVINGITLPKSGEWRPRFRGWSFIHIRSGDSYWQDPGGAREFSAGYSLVLAAESTGSLRASQLGEVVIAYFCMEPEKLTGLLSLSEQQSLKMAAARESYAPRILPPNDPLAGRFRNICVENNPATFSARLKLLQFFFDLLECESMEDLVESTPELDGRERLRNSLKQMAASEFVGLSLSELAPRMRCSTRHLSRLFRQEVGTSFREKQTELRLEKARELLATSNAKVVEVALTSGYHSYSLFAESFKKHFGVSPAKWRHQHGMQSARPPKLVRLPSL